MQSDHSSPHSCIVSIVINNFNYGRYLGQAIDSCLSQTYRNIELIVVDDGSIDESRAVIAKYGNRIKPVLKPNGGQSSALNAGFAVCTGDFICLLDSDDWFFSNKVEEVLRAFSTRLDAQWVFHPIQMVFPDGSTKVSPTQTQTKFIDDRNNAMNGKLTYVAPPTSALSFRRGFLSTIMPLSDDIVIASDNYLKFASLSLGAGISLNEILAAQRIHENNAYTLRSDRLLKQARYHLFIARDLRNNFPFLRRLSNGIFSRALSDYISARERDQQCKGAIVQYFRSSSVLSALEILLRVTYYRVRSQLLRRVTK
jgi:glycosyltransferase involved in cell wall biosynthesis